VNIQKTKKKKRTNKKKRKRKRVPKGEDNSLKNDMTKELAGTTTRTGASEKEKERARKRSGPQGNVHYASTDLGRKHTGPVHCNHNMRI